MSGARLTRDERGRWWVHVAGIALPAAPLLQALSQRRARGVAAGQLGGPDTRSLIEEVQAAARPTVEGWVRTLDRLERENKTLRDEGLLLHSRFAHVMSPALRSSTVIAAAEAHSRSEALHTVREWVYDTAGFVVDIDTHDAFSGAGLGAIDPASVALILAGLTLAGWIVYQVRLYAEKRAALTHIDEMVKKAANAKTPEERQAYLRGAENARDVVTDDSEDAAWMVGGVLVVLLVVWLATRAGGER